MVKGPGPRKTSPFRKDGRLRASVRALPEDNSAPGAAAYRERRGSSPPVQARKRFFGSSLLYNPRCHNCIQDQKKENHSPPAPAPATAHRKPFHPPPATENHSRPAPALARPPAPLLSPEMLPQVAHATHVVCTTPVQWAPKLMTLPRPPPFASVTVADTHAQQVQVLEDSIAHTFAALMAPIPARTPTSTEEPSASAVEQGPSNASPPP